jgi:hypothetical protein
MKQETPKLGTKEFNDLAMEMFGGKPKQQTAVEFLEEQLFLNNEPTLNQIWLIKEAKEMEKQQQGYSEEDMKQFGLYLGDNLKKLKDKTIDEIFEQYKYLQRNI